MRLIDTHCHLDDGKFAEDRAETIARARAAGVELMVAVGTGDGPPDLSAGVRLAEAHSFMYATVGVHPHDASKADDASFSELRRLAGHPKVVAIGEIGLDYHYDLSPRETQRAIFARQLALARETGLPVVVHTREAWSDTMAILREQPGPGVMHCFTGDAEQAREALALGFYLSFSGVITFPKAEPTREAARITPLNRVLIETDCPYLAPVPHRGKRNEPAFVAHVAQRLAEVRGCPVEDVAGAAWSNFESLCLRRVAPTG